MVYATEQSLTSIGTNDEAIAAEIAAHTAVGFRIAQVLRWPAWPLPPELEGSLDALPTGNVGRRTLSLAYRSEADRAAATEAYGVFSALTAQHGEGGVVAVAAPLELLEQHGLLATARDVVALMVRGEARAH